MDKTEKIIWDSRFSVGNTKIDDEHKKLIGVVNDLIEFVEFKKDREEFAKILSEMTDYCLTHFKKEENYMKKFAYPDFTKHHTLHTDYIYKVAMYNIELSENIPPDPKEIISFLEKWWTSHIMIVDREYEVYKNKIQSDVIYE